MRFFAGVDLEDEEVDGGTGATADEAFAEYMANYFEDDHANFCCSPDEELEVQIWRTREVTAEERAQHGWDYVLEELVEKRSVSLSTHKGESTSEIGRDA